MCRLPKRHPLSQVASPPFYLMTLYSLTTEVETSLFKARRFLIEQVNDDRPGWGPQPSAPMDPWPSAQILYSLPKDGHVDILLRGPHTLSPGERELIATCVSAQNDCQYCETIHGAIAAHHLGGDEELVLKVKSDFQHAPISDKLKALLVIAGKAAQSGKQVTAEDVDRAREQGATDLEIHDTVLIAAVFCLCNRYVDGLATWTPQDPEFYRLRGALVARVGYVAASAPAPTASDTSNTTM